MLAGASVAALVVPQGMSYARLAGLPQEYGLYGAFVPVMVYAALGSSKHLVSLEKEKERKFHLARALLLTSKEKKN